VSKEIPLGPGYVEPGIEAFIGMLDSGNPPVPYDQLLVPVSVLEAAAGAYAAGRRS
jgi:hypothetical protein